MINEKWKDIEGFEGSYQISNFGRVKSLKRTIEETNQYNSIFYLELEEKIKKPQMGRNGYLHVCLCKNSKKKTFRIHRLVAKNFLKNYKEELDVNHKDCNKQNNRVDNLEMVSRKENIRHAWKNNLCEKVREASKKNIKKATQIRMQKRRLENE